MVAVSRALQPLNALDSKVVTLLGMLMVFSFVHPEKALSPTTAQPSLMVAEVILIQSVNTLPSISSKLLLSSTLVSEVQLMKALPSNLRMLLGQLMSLRLVQLRNARKPICSMLLPSVTAVRSVQLSKALLPILFTVYVVPPLLTVAGMVTLPVYLALPATTATTAPFLSVMS